MTSITDFDLSSRDISALASADAIAAFLTRLGYPTGCRAEQSPTAFGISPDTAAAIRSMELLAEDDDQFFRVIFARLKSITAKTRNELVKNLGRRNVDHLLILAADFDVLEFALIDKETKLRHAPGGGPGVRLIPRVIAVDRKSPALVHRRILRRLTWTGKDGLDQFDKLRSVFQSAHYAEQYFINRALFADHYLRARLPEDAVWRESPAGAFDQAKRLMRQARERWSQKDEQSLRDELYDPVWKLLGYKAKINKDAKQDHLEPDYRLLGLDGQPATVAFAYRWDRWLDGADPTDADTPEENPGAAVVSALARGDARWIIVTNGKLWRLYSKDAHSRSTNFYEVDLEEALIASTETDPNEAFRYWWLFFRQAAFAPTPQTDPPACWLDKIVQGSRDYAKQLGDRLKSRVFVEIFPHLAQGFLHDRRNRLGLRKPPTDGELRDAFEATLTLLYRLLFLLYAESRDLLPIGEAAYRKASLQSLKAEIAAKAGPAESEVPDKLQTYAENTTDLYDRLLALFKVMDKGDAVLNVPCYNGGLFITDPAAEDGDNETAALPRERRIAAFLRDHKVPDRHLALAIDRLSRDPDDKTLGLVAIDYKSLEVRHLGSIYEGLLEFKLRIAEEDLGVATDKKAEKYIPLSQAKPARGRKKPQAAVVKKGDVYLSNDKSERKATGSYYTPDPIVEYIVEHTVGPVLEEKLDALRPLLDKAARDYHRHLANAKSDKRLLPAGTDPRAHAAAKTYAEHRHVVDRVFDLKVLDPAMGSGHFLVEAVDFITDRLLDFLNRWPNNPVRAMLNKTRDSILGALGEQGVTVDPAKLTDVNLLKRHVLKRCIYGVDLNPMAVELAKVSLWLDAFTLGAPLSFLDHHLRCGNSLVGERSAREHIFAGSGREADLRRAVQNMLVIAASADANPADVELSKQLFTDVERLAAPFKNRLHIETAGFFIDVDPVSKAAMISYPFDPVFVAEKPRPGRERSHAMYLKVLEAARNERFFHWELEFPEVYFGVSNAAPEQVTYRNDITAGMAGFDAIVGNPPYVRQESIKPFKAFLKTRYTTFDSTNDLYVYFQELEVENLRAGGRMGMIVANKWMRAGYGLELRRLLRCVAEPIEIIDFGHSPVFPDADTFPCIPIVARRAVPLRDEVQPSTSEVVRVCLVPRDSWTERMDLAAFVESRRYSIPTRLLKDEGWSLEDPQVQTLLQDILRRGTPLHSVVGTQAFFGIKTGFNEAFYVDSQTRDRLIAAHPKSIELLQPLLRGRDIRRWTTEPAQCFLIAIASSENRRWPWTDRGHMAESVFKKAYPAIAAHLLPYKASCEARSDQGSHWWELRSCAYYNILVKPKIVVKRIAYHSETAVDTQGMFANDSTTFIASASPSLLAMLNSHVMWWLMTRVLAHKKDEALAMDSTRLDKLPIPEISSSLQEQIEEITLRLTKMRQKYDDWQQDIIIDAIHEFDDRHIDDRIVSWLAMTDEVFAAKCRLVAMDGNAAGSPRRNYEAFRIKHRTRQVELLQGQLDTERMLARLIEQAYGLSPEECRLIRTTRPIRDPLDVLEAKIRGGNETETSTQDDSSRSED